MLARAYKAAGGGYRKNNGIKKITKIIKKWTSQKWDYISKGDKKNLEVKEVDIYLHLLESQ